ncbi:MAG: ROK family protein [Syntrophobacteraceae bacterium]
MSRKKCSIGIDLGGTKIAFGLVDEEGRVLELLRYETETTGGYPIVLEQLSKGVRQLEREVSCIITGIGIGVAGQVDPELGAVRFAPNLNWSEVPLRAELERECGIRVTVTNDVRAALWGEWLFGAGRGAQDLICIFVGTGIGGGIVSGGRVLEGCSNTAGEIGHMTIDLQGPECSCGNRGCMEALAGGWAIAQRTRDRIKAHPVSGTTILDIAGGRIEDISARTLVQAYYRGDALAKEIMDGVADALAAGTTALVNALNPCRIIFGGGVIEGMPELVKRIEDEVRRRSLSAATCRLVVSLSKLGKDAGIIGAAALATRTFPK